MELNDALAILGPSIGTVAASISYRAFRRSTRLDEFRRTYEGLRERQLRLSDNAYSRSPAEWKHHRIPLLTRDGWIADPPWSLDEVLIDLQPAKEQNGHRRRRPRSPMLPGLRSVGSMSYSDAVIEIIGMTHFFNGTIYRPIDIDFGGPVKKMGFSPDRYFRYLDTSEILAFYAASREWHPVLARRARKYRHRLRNPFDLENRVASLGILTLTLRVGPSGTTFLLHKRDPTRVVLGSDLFHVVPAGEFTPSDISHHAVKADFSLWRNICREYAEEFLDMDAAHGKGGMSIDFDTESPFKELTEARRTGALKVHVLGLGLDPLTWKPELLTAAVFDSTCFDDVFAGIVQQNDEGILILRNGVGLPFDAQTVDDYCTSAEMRPGAKACLSLAWQHRAALGLKMP